MSYKVDIENFEYDSRYSPTEHRWCFLYDKENVKKFNEKREKQDAERFKRNRVQSDPETTGQHGTMI